MGGKPRPARFEDLLGLSTGPLGDVMRALRALILDEHPDAVETVRLGDRAATYGFGPRKMKEGYAYILPYREHVNLGFYRGAALPDPKRLLEGTGALMRHIKVRELSGHETAELRALLRAARADRRRTLDPE